jgi:fatty acid synthase subunit alpha
MAARTLQLNTKKYNSLVPRQLLSFKSDRDIIYYEAEPGNDQKSRVPKWLLLKRAQELQTPVEVEKVAPPTPVPVRAAAAPTPSAATKPVGDRPVSAFETLQVLLAIKLKKPISEISSESTIKDLVGGKSAIQNEILGDLQKEFGSEPDSAATTPLTQLAQVMGHSYIKLGSQSQKLVSRVVSSKMPAGFGLTEIQDHLLKERDLGPGLTESVMMHSVLMEPEARLESITKSREWLDSVADAYGSLRGVSIGYRSNAGPGALNVTVNAVDSEVLKAYEKRHEALYRENMQSVAAFLGIDLRSGDRQAEAAGHLRQEVEKVDF